MMFDEFHVFISDNQHPKNAPPGEDRSTEPVKPAGDAAHHLLGKLDQG